MISLVSLVSVKQNDVKIGFSSHKVYKHVFPFKID